MPKLEERPAAITAWLPTIELDKDTFRECHEVILPALKDQLSNAVIRLMLELGDPPAHLPSKQDRETRLSNSLEAAKKEVREASHDRRISKTFLPARKIDLHDFSVEAFAHGMYGKRECQDVVALNRNEEAIIGCVCDGVSSVEFSRQGAILVSQFLVSRANELLTSNPQEGRATYSSPTDPRFLGQLHAELQCNLIEWSHRLNLSTDEASRHVFGTTIQLVIVTPKETALLAIGDGFYTHNSSHDVIPQFVTRNVGSSNKPEVFIRPFLHEESREGCENDGHTFHIVGAWPTESITRVGAFTDGANVCSDFNLSEGRRYVGHVQREISTNERIIASKEKREPSRVHLIWPSMDEIWGASAGELLGNLRAANFGMENDGGAATFSDYQRTPWPPFADDFAGIMVRRRKNL